MIDKLFILFRLFRDLSWKKKLLIFAVLAFCVSPILPHDDTVPVESVPAEHIINGANDFRIPAPYSEDNYQFKENNNEVSFTAMDEFGSMLGIDKLDGGEFEGLKDSPEFTDCYNGVDDLNYYYHKVSEVPDVPNVYKVVDVNGHEVMEDTVDIYFVEVVKVNGTYYKISISNPEINNPVFELDEWEDYLLEFNNANNLTTIKII